MKHLLFVSVLAACGGPAAKPVHAPDKPTAPVAITTVDQVMEGSLVAAGGRAKLAAMTSQRMVATMTLKAQGLKGTIESLSSPPNNSLTRVEIPGIGKIEQGVHGEIAWERNPLTGARVFTGIEKSTALRAASFQGDLNWKQLYPKSVFKGVTKYAEQDCYQIELTAADGQEETRYYAKDTLLPVGVEMVSETQMGKVPVKVINRDWRDQDGFKYPHTMQHEEASQTFEITVDKMEINVPIPAATFEPSDEIKQLAAAAK
jgi:hypothetical protein